MSRDVALGALARAELGKQFHYTYATWRGVSRWQSWTFAFGCSPSPWTGKEAAQLGYSGENTMLDARRVSLTGCITWGLLHCLSKLCEVLFSSWGS